MEKSEILRNETDELLEGAVLLEERFQGLVNDPLGTLMDGSEFFDERSADCEPLIENCNESLEALPQLTPPESKIRRNQYEDIKSRLETLTSDFSDLQDNTDTVLDPATDPTVKAAELAIIVSELPGIILEFIFMNEECEKIKEVFS